MKYVAREEKGKMFEIQYTLEMDEWLRLNYNKHRKKEVTRLFNEEFNTERTVWALSGRAHLLGISNKREEISIERLEEIGKRENDECIIIDLDKKELFKRARKTSINGYRLKKFYKHFALYEKTLQSGETLRKTYTYWDLSRLI